MEQVLCLQQELKNDGVGQEIAEIGSSPTSHDIGKATPYHG
jgi:hypothetical protein